jgi:YYY domain-containing protein
MERTTLLVHLLSWWLLVQLLGLAALPLAYRLFRWLPGRGYAFAKPLGLLLASYILWLGGSLGYLHNTWGGALAAVAATAGLSATWYVWRQDQGSPSLTSFFRHRWRMVVTVEILFAAGFIAWAALRAFAPDKIMSSGGEKFMEIAFLNGILQSPSFPPHDPWLSGFAISYYYFGYVMMALLTRLSGVLPGVGFELYDALMFALTLTGAFGVVHALVAGASPRPQQGRRQALTYGLLGSLFVAVMGNLEGLLEAFYARGILPRAFWEWIDIPDLIEAGRVTGSWYPGHGWWWWRASRVIRDRNLLGEPMALNPIDEFPFFSFLLGDNHPHVLALPFVLLTIALALNLLRRERGRDRVEADAPTAPWWNPIAYGLDGDWPLFGLYALTLGSLGFLNTWDFPIYIGLTSLAYAAARYVGARESLLEALGRGLGLGVALTLTGILLYVPFYIGFSSQAGGILPYLLPPTRLPQYLIMFGPFVFVAASFLLAHLVTGRGGSRPWSAAARFWAIIVAVPVAVLSLVLAAVALTAPGRQMARDLLADPRIQEMVGTGGAGAVVAAVLSARLSDPWLFLTLSLLMAGAVAAILQPWRRREVDGEPTTSAQFASLLFLCGLGLTYVVEFVYLRDSFGVRMNTIFKFYYQSWVMLGCASAFGVWWILNGSERRISAILETVFLVGVILLTVGGLVYTLMAGYSRVNGFQSQPNLNGAINIARSQPDDWAAIEWLRANAQGTPVILEAPGHSYDYEGRISAFTGYPAVLGWAVHESQWRGNYVEQGKREPDIETIYTSPDQERAMELLRKWEVDYVVVGPPERAYAREVCQTAQAPCSPTQGLRKLERMLVLVFEQGRTTIYRVPQG